jgi:hypothetical protein
MQYIIEIDRFRDLLSADVKAWNNNIQWKFIDESCDLAHYEIPIIEQPSSSSPIPSIKTTIPLLPMKVITDPSTSSSAMRSPRMMSFSREKTPRNGLSSPPKTPRHTTVTSAVLAVMTSNNLTSSSARSGDGLQVTNRSFSSQNPSPMHAQHHAYHDKLYIGGSTKWPSTKIPHHTVVEHIETIWNKYLSDNSSNQICIPSRVLENTKKRLALLHLYGKEVFQETTIDPIKTLYKDVLPRFLNSIYCREMERRLHELFPLPNENDLNLELPKYSNVMKLSLNQLTVEKLARIELKEILNDRILYSQFLFMFIVVISPSLFFLTCL